MTSTVPKHEIISVTVDQTELKQQCYDVRVAVFIHEQGLIRVPCLNVSGFLSDAD